MPAAGGGNTRKKQLKKKKPVGQYTPGSTTPVSYSKPKPKVKQRPVKAPAGDASGGYNLKPAKKIERKRVKAQKRRQSEVKDTKSDRELSTAKTFKQFDRYKDLQEKVRGKRLQRAFRDDDVDTIEKISDRHAASASAASPVLKVLDQTTRPLHAIAGAARKDVQEFKKHGPAGLVGHGSLKEAGKGIRNETKNTFSDVLKEAGVKNKGVAGAVGFGLDVALDPTTYATFGASSPARAAARSAARKAERTAVKSGSGKAAGQAAETQARKRADAAKSPLTPKQAKAVRKTAERKHVKRAGQKAADKVEGGATNRGLDVRFAGQSVPGVTRSTAAVKRAPRKVVSATRVDRTRAGAAVDRAQQKVRDAARSTAAEVNPNITPVGVERETYQAMRRAARTARAKSQRGDVYAALSAQSFRDRIGEDNFQKVLYAIEEGTVAKLPKNLRAEARRWSSLNRKRLKTERRAGIKVGDVTRDARVKAVGPVPEVTADVGAAQKALRDAQVARNRTERQHGRQTHKAGVAEGKARVLVGQSDRKRRGRVMYHVVRDSGVSHKTKLAAIKNEGLRPSSNGYVYLYDDAAQAAEFAKGGGKILKVNVDDLPLGGAEGAATRTVKGAIPADRIVRGRVLVGQSDRKRRKLRPAQKATGDAPPVPKGHVRLYRGEGIHPHKGEDWGDAPEGSGPTQGRWFTEDQARAEGYAKTKLTGYVRYVDVPEAVAKAARIDDKGRSTFVLPDEWATRAGEHTPGGIDAALSKQAEIDAAPAKLAEIRLRKEAAKAKLEGREPRKLKNLEGTRPTKTLGRLETERGKLYAMEKGQVVGKARQAVRDAEAALEATKAQARKQRGHRIRKQNALKRAEAAPVDYVKHLRIDLDDAGSKVASGKGPGRVRMDSAKKRESGLLREENLANPGRFSEDAGVIEATRASEHSRSLAKAEMNRALAAVGRRFDKKQDARSQLRDNEAVYKAEGTDLVRVKPEDIKSGKAPSGQLVILNEKAVERTAGTVQTAGSRTTPGVVFDKAQGIWKLGATVVNPGYYVRNFAGEAKNAYLLERPDRLLKNAVTSGRALKEVRKREEAVRRGEPYPVRGGDGTPREKRTSAGPDSSLRFHQEFNRTERGKSQSRAAVLAEEMSARPGIKDALLEWTRGGGFGGMRLRNAEKVREAFEPVREALRAEHGPTIPLYRGQRPYAGKDTKRTDFSWSSNRDEAAGFIADGGKLLEREVPVENIVAVYRDAGTGYTEFIVRNAPKKRVRAQRSAAVELIDKAEAVGAVRAGQYARELGQQLSSEKKGRAASLKKGAGPLRAVGRARDNVEDIFRLASFKGGLDRGLTPERAQQRAAKNHFDYGDLSESERKVLRRVMPFYTFSSRNIPLQIKSLVTRPGKFANYQKVREELGKAFGFEDGWEDRLSEVEQRSAPFPVKWKGKEFTLSLGPSGLPLTDLNEFPVELLEDPLNPASYDAVVDEWTTRAFSMVSPAFKTPLELHENISFFFRDQLERDTGPLVPAPAWVKVMPKQFREMTGYTDNYRNPKDGSSGPGWRAKADYLVNILPGPAQFANRLAREGSSKEQSTGSKVVQYFGPRLRPVEVKGVQVNKAYDEQAKLRKQQAGLRQQNHPLNGDPISANNPTPEYTRSLARSRALDKKIAGLRGVPASKAPAPSTTRRVSKRPAPSSTGRFQFGSEPSSGSSSGGSSGRFTFK